MKSKPVVEALGALAQESRLAIFRLLVKRGSEGFQPGDLSRQLGISAPTLSFHLKALLVTRLITSRRKGRAIFYSANYERIQGVVSFLTDECCGLAEMPGDPCCVPMSKRSPS